VQNGQKVFRKILDESSSIATRQSRDLGHGAPGTLFAENGVGIRAVMETRSALRWTQKRV